MIVGEAPGFHEDRQGEPFVRAAGKLLDTLLARIGLGRTDVYITNVLKCRPPQNRDPMPNEVEACSPYLARQMSLVKPKVVLVLGRHALERLLPGQGSISRIHGSLVRRGEVAYVPLFHPAAARWASTCGRSSGRTRSWSSTPDSCFRRRTCSASTSCCPTSPTCWRSAARCSASS